MKRDNAAFEGGGRTHSSERVADIVAMARAATSRRVPKAVTSYRTPKGRQIMECGD